MTHENQKAEYRTNNIFSVLVGMLIGGLAGAVAMLLMAPQSGKDTRTQIQEKGIELRDRTTEIVGDVMAQVRLDKDKFTISGRQKAKELLTQGQALVVEQLDRVSEAAQDREKSDPKFLG